MGRNSSQGPRNTTKMCNPTENRLEPEKVCWLTSSLGNWSPNRWGMPGWSEAACTWQLVAIPGLPTRLLVAVLAAVCVYRNQGSRRRPVSGHQIGAQIGGLTSSRGRSKSQYTGTDPEGCLQRTILTQTSCHSGIHFTRPSIKFPSSPTPSTSPSFSRFSYHPSLFFIGGMVGSVRLMFLSFSGTASTKLIVT